MKKKYDIIIIGAGLGSLTTAALLAKRGLSVAVLERNDYPGGSCGSFRLNGRTIDQGTAMLFGFGDTGFNPHRYVFDLLEEEIEVVAHKYLYRLIYDGHPILFHSNLNDYYIDLKKLFPSSISQIKDFYEYALDFYKRVLSQDKSYMSPSEIKPSEGLKSLFTHPLRTLKLISLLKKSAGDIVRRFVKDEEVIKFFNKLTSTYCYTLLDETPAMFAVSMFIENHFGGSYYPLGGSHQLALKLEKAGERYGADYFYRNEVNKIIFTDGQPVGVEVNNDGQVNTMIADVIVYGGVLKPLYQKMIPKKHLSQKLVEKVLALKMSYPSVVFYAIINKEGLPKGTLPIEMMADNPDLLDEKEITLYAFSLSDPSICQPDEHVIMAIGPSLRTWPHPENKEDQMTHYKSMKKEETIRMLSTLDKHYPNLSSNVKEYSLASPTTIEHFTLKDRGAVVGPKQSMGQELLKRQHAQGEWDSFYFVGESTVMGTGSAAVTISGYSAANLILRKRGMKEYAYRDDLMKQVKVHAERAPKLRFDGDRVLPALNAISDEIMVELHDKSSLCQWCIDASCRKSCPFGYEITHIMRKLECGNILGAKKALNSVTPDTLACIDCDASCEKDCLAKKVHNKNVPIKELNMKVFAQ